MLLTVAALAPRTDPIPQKSWFALGTRGVKQTRHSCNFSPKLLGIQTRSPFERGHAFGVSMYIYFITFWE
jgi:hypothetical protein